MTAIWQDMRYAARSLRRSRGSTATAVVVLSISIGLAECSAGDTLRSLLQRSDSALYQAKRTGKGRLATKAAPLIRDLLKQR